MLRLFALIVLSMYGGLGGATSLRASPALVTTLHLVDQTSGSTTHTNQLTVGLSVDGPSPGGASFLLTESVSAPAASADGWGPMPSSFDLAAEGESGRVVYWWAKDGGEAVTQVAVASTIYDPAMPSASFTPPVQVTEGRLINIDINAFDAHSMPADLRFQVSETNASPGEVSGTWVVRPATFELSEGDGQKTIYGWVKDPAGNVAAFDAPATTILDTADPLASIAGVPSLTRSRTVPVTIDGSDAGGIAGYFLSESGTPQAVDGEGWVVTPPTEFTMTSAGDGAKTIYAWTKDVADRVSERVSATTTLDSTAPGVGLNAPKLTRKHSVSIGVTSFGAATAYIVASVATKPLPGDPRWVAEPPTAYLLPGGDGSKRVYAFARDLAGNVSVPAVATVVLDTKAPVARIKAPANGAKPSGFAAIRGVASDRTSGVAGVWVALRRQVKAACTWWDGAKWVERACGAKLWLKLNGTSAWVLRFPRVTTPANYTAFAYAVDAAGNRQGGFVTGVNKVTFHIVSKAVRPRACCRAETTGDSSRFG